MAAKVVIKGETGDGGGEIAVAGKRLAFNREGIKEVRRGRRGDVTCLSTPRTVVEERRGAEKTDQKARGEESGGMNGAFLWVPGCAG